MSRDLVVSIALNMKEYDRLISTCGQKKLSVHVRELALEGLDLRDLARKNDDAAIILGRIIAG